MADGIGNGELFRTSPTYNVVPSYVVNRNNSII